MLVGLFGHYGQYGRYGRYGSYGSIGQYGVYGAYGRRRGAQLTNFLFASTCILVFEHRALVFPCMSRSPVFFSSEVFSTASGFFFVPSQTRARKKNEKKEKEKKKSTQ